MEAQQHGSRAVRERLHIIGVKSVSPSHKLPHDDFDSILQAMQMARLAAEKFINVANLPAPVTSTGETPVSEGFAEKKIAIYKDDHLELYAQHSLRWPPDVSGPAYQGLTRRAAEVLYFAHHMWPHTPSQDDKYAIEFLDVNNSLARLLGSKFVRGGGTPAQSELPSPWKAMAMTITGHSIICVRMRVDGVVHLRKAHAYEVMSLAGWDWSWWKPGRHLESESLGISLAGNAFSGFCIGPVVTAALVAHASILEATKAGTLVPDEPAEDDLLRLFDSE